MSNIFWHLLVLLAPGSNTRILKNTPDFRSSFIDPVMDISNPVMAITDPVMAISDLVLDISDPVMDISDRVMAISDPVMASGDGSIKLPCVQLVRQS